MFGFGFGLGFGFRFEFGFGLGLGLVFDLGEVWHRSQSFCRLGAITALSRRAMGWTDPSKEERGSWSGLGLDLGLGLGLGLVLELELELELTWHAAAAKRVTTMSQKRRSALSVL